MSANGICQVREPFNPSCKIFYCNGMTTSREDAQAHVDEIRKMTSADVELHHNDTTSMEKTMAMGAKLAGGAGLCAYSVCSEKKSSEKKALDTFLGIFGVASVIWGLSDYAEIQDQKNESAQELADKVISHLQQKPRSHVTLIFHSQGADIGSRALNLLERYKDRIHVVTIGGMVDIPECFASRVVNFVDESDVVAQMAQATFGKLSKKVKHVSTKVTTENRDCETMACHGATDYLKVPTIRKTITRLGGSKR